jgi:hypothetical protein
MSYSSSSSDPKPTTEKVPSSKKRKSDSSISSPSSSRQSTVSKKRRRKNRKEKKLPNKLVWDADLHRRFEQAIFKLGKRGSVLLLLLFLLLPPPLFRFLILLTLNISCTIPDSSGDGRSLPNKITSRQSFSKGKLFASSCFASSSCCFPGFAFRF